MNRIRPLLLALLPACAALAQEHTFFAFDDHCFPWQDNLKLTLHQAEKHPGNPVLRAGPKGAPDHGHAIAYGTVLELDGKLRMWYCGMPDTSFDAWRKSRWRPMCYAESEDGVTWTKPNLGLVEINGSKANNACLIESAAPFLDKVDDALSVLHDPADPDPARRFKCVYIAHMPFNDTKGGLRDVGGKKALGDAGEGRVGQRRETAANVRTAMMITAVSADGLRWKVVGDRPALDEKLEISGLYKWDGFYHAGGQQLSPWTWRADGSDTAREMVVYRSADFVNWSSAKARAFSRAGQQTAAAVAGQQTHMGAGLWNRGNVLVGLYGLWQDGPKDKPAGAPNLHGTSVDLGLVLSNDGIHFREPVPGFKVIERGPPGAWDDTALLQAHAFVNRGGQTLLWYSHWDTGGQLRNMHIGLARLRRDGFGSLGPKDPARTAHADTTWLPANAKKEGWSLGVNVDGATPASPLVLEVLDGRGQAIPGLRAEITASGTSVPVRFGDVEKTPAQQRIALRVRFPAGSQARLYALYLN